MNVKIQDLKDVTINGVKTLCTKSLGSYKETFFEWTDVYKRQPLSLWITWKPSAKKWTLSWERVPATCFLSVLLEVPRSYKGRKKTILQPY